MTWYNRGPRGRREEGCSRAHEGNETDVMRGFGSKEHLRLIKPIGRNGLLVRVD